MSPEELFLRRAVVFGSALVYWAGVAVQARRVRRHIGRSPNVKPKGTKETFLWLGWFLVVAAWLVQPLLVGLNPLGCLLRFYPALLHLLTLAFGVAVVIAGYLGTLWCYSAMGDSWRMGIDPKEKNSLVATGPYRWIRHPIYGFQILMLAGVALLLPTPLSLLVLLLHLLCVWIKAADEEAYLLTLHGQDYQKYTSRTGRLWPRVGPPGTD